MRFSCLLVLPFVHGAFCLLGYDCGGAALNVTTISLFDIGECHPPEDRPISTTTYIQPLQAAEYSRIRIISCRVEIDRHLFYCCSHISLIQGGHRKYIIDLDQSSYTKMHATGSFSYGPNAPVIDLLSNATNYRTLTLAGTASVDGTCKGTQFSDYYGTWNDVVVKASLYISYKDYYTIVKPAQDLIIL
ncbi:hypothetical protein EAI_08677 [Harpegnathos saltator]|uniref:Uncharacterized protein n=1 Tax=Harpegnathos saltator TaxID=610380 RepID=E2C4I7_HARSA|nr:hypothetical protein EAI_08677 [Harpegnathos saltator]